jgi:hypothetical protein
LTADPTHVLDVFGELLKHIPSTGCSPCIEREHLALARGQSARQRLVSI